MMTYQKIAYFFLFLAMAINIFGRRLAPIQNHRHLRKLLLKISKRALVQIFGNTLPIIELIIGLMLLVYFRQIEQGYANYYITFW